VQGVSSARGNDRQGTGSMHNPADQGQQKMGRMLMQKFNPFTKRAGESLAAEYGGSRKKPMEERKMASGIYPRSYRGPASPYKISKDPGESFLDLYSDAEFEDLETAEIINRLNKNLKSFRSFHAKASKQVEDLKKQQEKNQNASKGREMTPEEQEVNEELDKRMSQLFELQVKIKSIEQLISKLNEEEDLVSESAKKNQKLKDNEEELQRKDEELADERRANQEFIESLKEDLNDKINEV
jgi:DNA repair exonuclease SbcCD ATPase subunit